MTLYISILPMTLVSVPDAVGQLVSAIESAGMIPQQIILGVSETEVISQLDEFTVAVRQLRQADISLSIDNLGDGSAGLSLLAHAQPARVSVPVSCATSTEAGQDRPWCMRCSAAVRRWKLTLSRQV